jgi:hypothetical protein
MSIVHTQIPMAKYGNTWFKPAVWQYTAFAKNHDGEIVKIIGSFKYGFDGVTEDVFCKLRAYHHNGREALPVEGLYGKEISRHWVLIPDQSDSNGLIYNKPSMHALMYWFNHVMPGLESNGYYIVAEEEYEFQEFMHVKGMF